MVGGGRSSAISFMVLGGYLAVCSRYAPPNAASQVRNETLVRHVPRACRVVVYRQFMNNCVTVATRFSRNAVCSFCRIFLTAAVLLTQRCGDVCVAFHGTFPLPIALAVMAYSRVRGALLLLPVTFAVATDVWNQRCSRACSAVSKQRLLPRE
jgi:hypothetical protein